jgi:hypothetical protein
MTDLEKRTAILAEIFGEGIPFGFISDLGGDLTKPTIKELRKAAEKFALKDYKRLIAREPGSYMETSEAF